MPESPATSAPAAEADPVAAAGPPPADLSRPDRPDQGRAGAVAEGPTEVDRGTLRLALVVGGLVLAVLLGFGLGRVNPPPTSASSGTVPGPAAHTHAPGTGAHSHDGSTATQGGGADADGLSISAAGYTLAPLTVEFPVGRASALRFQIRDEQRRPVTRFAVVHEKPLHLIVVRRDLTGYLHLHPTMAADGTWSVPLTLPEAGVWRAYADFTAIADDGRQTAVTLGVDLAAPGGYTPRPLPAPATSTTLDGFTVGYEGTPKAGETLPVRFSIRTGGAAATLEPYLGAYGHLVALREGDLGYLHVHPGPQAEPGTVTFLMTAPGPGRYRMFLDFQVAGVVRTAEFTVTVA
ncbi:hypothetical protein [Micromonospora sp. NPDC093277]|uniref:hypothetical protein n=1 Tax=Micromonospora sp. NPDC093277 TaxID=3364291 RepID=UPI003808C5E9